MDSIQQMCLEYIQNNPGCSGMAIRSILPNGTNTNTISCTLNRLRTMGVVYNDGKGNRFTKWFPVEFSENKFCRALAKTIIDEMKELPSSMREVFLAEKLEELLEYQLD